ncbi:glycosyltransferase family protein [Pseudomonas fluvialis]|uniref:hypothetical protein n=1 Tax=Pseudomonas fluvialis TaxID=1793966 RepID=UPI00370A4396
MSKGTILYIGGFELPDRNAAAHRVLSNGMIMRDLGYDVVFLGIDSTRIGKPEILRNDYLGFECWSITYPKDVLAWLKYILGLTSILDFILRERTIKIVGVVCYNYPSVAQARIKSLCKRIGAKMIADATEWYSVGAGSGVYRIVKLLDTALRMYIVHRIADGVITTSKYLTEFYAHRGKVTVELPTLFNCEKFQPPPSRDNTQRKKFIYVGSPFDKGRVNKARSNLKERLDVAIEVFYQIYISGRRFSFEIYGVDADDYLEIFPEHADILKEMAECIVFKGRQPNQFVLNRIAECDFSIFFRDETRVTLAGFPSKLAESISCGTPVVTNKMVSLESYLPHESLFTTARGDEHILVRKIMELTPVEINYLKQHAYHSMTFDYKNYSDRVSVFMAEVVV